MSDKKVEKKNIDALR